MVKWLPWLGTDTEEVGPDYVKIEYNPNRVDFSSYGGIARAFKGLMNWEIGLPEFQIKKGQIKLEVNEDVKGVRPYVVSAVVRELNLNNDNIKELMEMQEDLHWMIGRNRKKASIGVHNLDVVEPPFSYITSDPSEVSFVPLDKTEKMTLKEILEKHEKGIAYKDEVMWASRYPLIVDKNEDVLSFPPVINGELTKIDRNTRNIFIDVTGTDYNSISRSLNVLVTALSDMGGIIESTKVDYNNHSCITPNLTPQKMNLRIDFTNQLLGKNFSEYEIVTSLQKSRLGASRIKKGLLEVTIPSYRIDILHEIDLVEDVAIGYGIFRLKPTIPTTVTSGNEHKISKIMNRIRQIMIGFGYIEALNFVLTNEIDHYYKMKRKADELVTLSNPVSRDFSILRNYLLPCLMKNLSDNRHNVLPQRMFEVSDVIKIDNNSDTNTERKLHLAGVSSHPKANFTEIKSIVESLLMNIGIKKWTINEMSNSSFLRGRVAAINFSGNELGIVGEIHPEVLNNFEIENPTSAFEIDIQKIIQLIK